MIARIQRNGLTRVLDRCQFRISRPAFLNKLLEELCLKPMNSLSTRGTWLFHKEEIQLYGLSVLSFLVAFHSRLCLLRRYNQDLIPGTCEDFIYE